MRYAGASSRIGNRWGREAPPADPRLRSRPWPLIESDRAVDNDPAVTEPDQGHDPFQRHSRQGAGNAPQIRLEPVDGSVSQHPPIFVHLGHFGLPAVDRARASVTRVLEKTKNRRLDAVGPWRRPGAPARSETAKAGPETRLAGFSELIWVSWLRGPYRRRRFQARPRYGCTCTTHRSCSSRVPCPRD